MIAYFALANSNVALRRYECAMYSLGADRVLTVDVIANRTSLLLFCRHAGWAHVSLDGGVNWLDVPADPENGQEIGPVSGRRTIKLKLNIPVEESVRWKSIGFGFGLGV